MKIVGLITEYNPFHNGHLYHIKKSKELTGADAVLVVMSGDYVQRGAPALIPKHVRARMALEAGACAVLELPVCFSTGSAEYFAAGAVALLQSLGCVDSLCFGSECGDINALATIAHILANEPEDYRSALKEALKDGMSFPQARQTAFTSYFTRHFSDQMDSSSLSEILAHPNNILGIEYLKALEQLHSSIVPYTITRTGAGYHEKTLDLDGDFSSASAIREIFAHGEQFPDEQVFHKLQEQLPPAAFQILKDTYNVRYPVYANDFSLLLKYRLLSETPRSLTRYADVSEDLASRMIRYRNDFISYDQFCERLKSKDLTYTRVSRALLHILLDIMAEDLKHSRAGDLCHYARLLGFRTDSTKVLSCLKKHALVPMITKLTQTNALTDAGQKMLSSDIHAANLYESVITEKYKTPFLHEYQQQVVKIDPI